MFNIGFSELIIVLIVAFVVVGPKDLPKVARALARLLKKSKAVIRQLKEESGWNEAMREGNDFKKDVKDMVKDVDVTKEIKQIKQDVDSVRKATDSKEIARSIKKSVQETLSADDVKQELGSVKKEITSALDEAKKQA